MVLPVAMFGAVKRACALAAPLKMTDTPGRLRPLPAGYPVVRVRTRAVQAYQCAPAAIDLIRPGAGCRRLVLGDGDRLAGRPGRFRQIAVPRLGFHDVLAGRRPAVRRAGRAPVGEDPSPPVVAVFQAVAVGVGGGRVKYDRYVHQGAGGPGRGGRRPGDPFGAVLNMSLG